MARKQPDPPPLESREFRSPEEIDAAVAKLRSRIEQFNKLDLQAAVLSSTGADATAESDVCASIREIFGLNSDELREHQYIRIFDGAVYRGYERPRAYRG